MPVRVRNWHDPYQRLIYALDRQLDQLVRSIDNPAPRSTRSQRTDAVTRGRPKICNAFLHKCCGNPNIVYCKHAHDYVCRTCAVARSATFDEIGNTVQFEQRKNCSPIQHAPLPYNRNKHFRKVLRDITNMHIRVPNKLLLDIKSALGPTKPTVSIVRTFLREHKLYHYYTSSNNIARALGDDTKRIHLNTRAYNVLCEEADALSRAFDKMKETGMTKRKNFVNVHVLILDICTRKFNLPEISSHLRLPRNHTTKNHLQVLQEVYTYLHR